MMEPLDRPAHTSRAKWFIREVVQGLGAGGLLGGRRRPRGPLAMTIRLRALSDEEREELGRMTRSRTLGAGRVRAPSPDRHARAGRPQGAGDRRPHGAVRGHGPSLAQALQRARARWAGGGRAYRAAADLLRGAEGCGDQRRAYPAGEAGPAIGVLDP